MKNERPLYFLSMLLALRDSVLESGEIDPRPERKILSGQRILKSPELMPSGKDPTSEGKKPMGHNRSRDILPLSRRDRVEQSREFMEQHFDQRLEIPSLAAQANVSISHFFKLFKQDTGCTPLAYLTQLKIERACDLLITTTASVKLIAANLGFRDPFYFSRVFKSVTGMAPKAYRRLKRNGRECPPSRAMDAAPAQVVKNQGSGKLL
jgi:AraC-like DNA-binding protein